MTMEGWLLDLLVCPKCHGALVHETDPEALRCPEDGLRFPVRDGIPVLLLDEAEPVGEAPAG